MCPSISPSVLRLGKANLRNSRVAGPPARLSPCRPPWPAQRVCRLPVRPPSRRPCPLRSWRTDHAPSHRARLRGRLLWQTRCTSPQPEQVATSPIRRRCSLASILSAASDVEYSLALACRTLLVRLVLLAPASPLCHGLVLLCPPCPTSGLAPALSMRQALSQLLPDGSKMTGRASWTIHLVACPSWHVNAPPRTAH